MTPPWLWGVVVACDRLPGSREAIVGELVIGDAESCRQEAATWLRRLPEGDTMRRHWLAMLGAP